MAAARRELDLVPTPATIDIIGSIEKGLGGIPNLAVIPTEPLAVPPGARSTSRRQSHAPTLLDHLGEGPRPRLWVVEEDLYADGLSFVFGLAVRGRGGVVSIARLPDVTMAAKEAIHEAGHVFGLAHCRNTCVMQFSSDLRHAQAKPATFCGTCRGRLDRPG